VKSPDDFRKEPPTKEELLKNLAIMQLKKKNAALLDEKNAPKYDHAALKRDETGQKTSFPQYEEFEVMPGKGPRGQRE
jgi:NADH dehydrogenase [ubiquinone] 1 alpha subcomplex assembly factor 2